MIPEELRTEVRFLYTVDSEEAQEAITASRHDYHIGLGQSTYPRMHTFTHTHSLTQYPSFTTVKAHLNCATLSHEYALKYNSFSRDLTDIKPLCQVRQYH